ncbi:MAG TPA: NAD(P)H-dependent oxidoreductase subunit E [Patescibacteria group bacterium]|nr:NAD(P)H-dependent oxidoreductase subunit E [Patescibacteria group bacterium]
MNIDEPIPVTQEILSKYPREQRYTLTILQDLQREHRYIPREALPLVAAHVSLPLAKLYSMATFYKSFSLSPRGKNLIKVCDGTACHIRSSLILVDEIQRLLDIAPGETTPDRQYSLETVNCLGSCAIAPVMVINDTYYSKVTPAGLRNILSDERSAINET